MLHIQLITQQGEALQNCIQLFIQYANELNEDLCFQSFDAELDNPLKKYGPPMGSLLLAYWHNQPIGCVALTNITGTATSHQPKTKTTNNLVKTCEMKRLYVQPAFRKHKIGEALVKEILLAAQQLNYAVMMLDTLQRLQPAIQLYLKYGFTSSNAYYKNPLHNVVYMQKLL